MSSGQKKNSLKLAPDPVLPTVAATLAFCTPNPSVLWVHLRGKMSLLKHTKISFWALRHPLAQSKCTWHKCSNNGNKSLIGKQTKTDNSCRYKGGLRSAMQLPLSKLLIDVTQKNLCSSILWAHPDKQLIPCITGIDQSVRDWLRWRWIHIVVQTAVPRLKNVAPVMIGPSSKRNLDERIGWFQQRAPMFHMICFMSVFCANIRDVTYIHLSWCWC